MEYAPIQWAALKGTQRWHATTQQPDGTYQFKSYCYGGPGYSSKKLWQIEPACPSTTTYPTDPEDLTDLFVKHRHETTVQISSIYDDWSEELVSAMLQPQRWYLWKELGPVAAQWLRNQINRFPRLGRCYSIVSDWPHILEPNNAPFASSTPRINPGESLALACILFGTEVFAGYNIPNIAKRLSLLRHWNPKTQPLPLTKAEIARLHYWLPQAFTKTWDITAFKEPQLEWLEPGQLTTQNGATFQVTSDAITNNTQLYALRLNQTTVLVPSNHHPEITKRLGKRGFQFIHLSGYQVFKNTVRNTPNLLTSFCLQNQNWASTESTVFATLRQWLDAESNEQVKQGARPALELRLRIEEMRRLHTLRTLPNCAKDPIITDLRILAQIVDKHCPTITLSPETLAYLL